ncbi:hypothetical protein BCR39DRAFT_303345 [Naematelia encephala]|uniref:Secreted protein n=1 Tax=Naematelia encephala TaxID=71784 RepID=A0A1Y2BHA6_9TREE|nr:hypothetical protein BCR39DRAFT_303345 [Naematelia encephala]
MLVILVVTLVVDWVGMEVLTTKKSMSKEGYPPSPSLTNTSECRPSSRLFAMNTTVYKYQLNEQHRSREQSRNWQVEFGRR